MIESHRSTPKPEFSEGLKYKKVIDVPFIRQEYGNWCGYASLNMLLRYRGVNMTNEELFLQAYPELNGSPRLSPKDIVRRNGPTFGHLAAIASDILGDEYNVKLLYKGKHKDTEKNIYLKNGTYQDYEKKNPKFTPFFLLDTFLKGEHPAMLRFYNHTVVASGLAVETNGDSHYLINSALERRPRWRPKSELEDVWSRDDCKQTINPESERDKIDPIMRSSYMMLTIYPKRI